MAPAVQGGGGSGDGAGGSTGGVTGGTGEAGGASGGGRTCTRAGTGIRARAACRARPGIGGGVRLFAGALPRAPGVCIILCRDGRRAGAGISARVIGFEVAGSFAG